MIGTRRSVLMRFTFVRHGETQANKDRCIQGHTDIPLCQSGEEQASRAGERLRDVRFSRVYASDLCRASTTCRLILAKNTRHPPPLIIDTRLRERNFGSIEGLVFEEVLKMAEANGSSWPQYSPPGAESLGDVQARLVAFFKEVCQSIYDKNNNNLKKREAVNSVSEKEEKKKKEEEADMEEENMLNEAKEKEEKERKKEQNKNEKTNADKQEEEEEEEHVLVVSHGAALRQLYLHLHHTLGCPVPPSIHPDTPARLSPNTGISTYSIRYSPKSYTLQCLCLHDSQHLQGM
ncbi:fructose-2,6-bisphosphatase TIGAR-like [Portunus trituberculatus]|uniref:fructose-2,6-bisphosphatase TIGAR-like n=1 Tax=Portunus trituberculatus TaxID=210409 RepID=UPI001E1CD80C|nr:fructose-2,6-bisphosphatase TIGAR-like [Portunus trituberculatus]